MWTDCWGLRAIQTCVDRWFACRMSAARRSLATSTSALFSFLRSVTRSVAHVKDTVAVCLDTASQFYTVLWWHIAELCLLVSVSVHLYKYISSFAQHFCARTWLSVHSTVRLLLAHQMTMRCNYFFSQP